MKLKKVRDHARLRTRRAILEAVADVVSETNGIGFSVQTVADRAGVTHRTVYNHFPTREALCEGYASYVDELLLSSAGEDPGGAPSFGAFPGIASRLYKTLALRERHARAYVMLMIGNRQPLKTWRDRSRVIEQHIVAATSGNAPIEPRLVTAAVRMFVSSMGWHLLTEQCGLSTNEAAVTSEWATRTLLEAATSRRASMAPASTSGLSQRGPDATRRRRN